MPKASGPVKKAMNGHGGRSNGRESKTFAIAVNSMQSKVEANGQSKTIQKKGMDKLAAESQEESDREPVKEENTNQQHGDEAKADQTKEKEHQDQGQEQEQADQSEQGSEQQENWEDNNEDSDGKDIPIVFMRMSEKDLRPIQEVQVETGELKGHVISVLLDTGAERSVINETYAKKLGLVPVAVDKPVKVTSSDRTSRGEIVRRIVQLPLRFVPEAPLRTLDILLSKNFPPTDIIVIGIWDTGIFDHREGPTANSLAW
jgi:hypothetical protein